jgi:hypothetical protein
MTIAFSRMPASMQRQQVATASSKQVGRLRDQTRWLHPQIVPGRRSIVSNTIVSALCPVPAAADVFLGCTVSEADKLPPSTAHYHPKIAILRPLYNTKANHPSCDDRRKSIPTDVLLHRYAQ